MARWITNYSKADHKIWSVSYLNLIFRNGSSGLNIYICLEFPKCFQRSELQVNLFTCKMAHHLTRPEKSFSNPRSASVITKKNDLRSNKTGKRFLSNLDLCIIPKSNFAALFFRNWLKGTNLVYQAMLFFSLSLFYVICVLVIICVFSNISEHTYSGFFMQCLLQTQPYRLDTGIIVVLSC